MIKKVLSALFCFSLSFGLSLPISAETMYSEEDWTVTFTADEKMESNFTTGQIDDLLYSMQPGDDAQINILVRNKSSNSTNWYMKNDVLDSLEDSVKVASGGAYSYRLVYKGPNGQENTLFDSSTLGGEGESPAGEGLNAATNALDDYFYLGTLEKNQSGMVSLNVALDGETQGNSYQSTLANLEMRFAVEINNNGTDSVSASSTNASTGTTTVNRVNTAAMVQRMPWLIGMAIAGCALFILAFLGWKERRENKR